MKQKMAASKAFISNFVCYCPSSYSENTLPKIEEISFELEFKKKII